MAAPALAGQFVDGEFTTYDQNIWGADPSDGPPASMLPVHFFDVFTAGAEFGYPFPGEALMDFSSAEAMLTYLPQSGAPSSLDANLLDPTSSSSGAFGGQVVALGLNIGFGDHGFLSHPADVSFGDLVPPTSRARWPVSTVSPSGNSTRSSTPRWAAGSAVRHCRSRHAREPDEFFVRRRLPEPFALEHLELPAVTAPVPEPATLLLMLASMSASGSPAGGGAPCYDLNLREGANPVHG
jgi:hypothetical protein